MDVLMECKANPNIITRQFYDVYPNKHNFVRVPQGSSAVDIWKTLHSRSNDPNGSVLKKLIDYRCSWVKPLPVQQQSSPTIHEAALSDDPEQLKAALDGGADVNGKDINGYTALINAVQAAKQKSLFFLLHNKADVHATDNFGWSALMIACSRGDGTFVDLLLKHGAKKEIRSTAALTEFVVGTTALDIANYWVKKGFWKAGDFRRIQSMLTEHVTAPSVFSKFDAKSRDDSQLVITQSNVPVSASSAESPSKKLASFQDIIRWCCQNGNESDIADLAMQTLRVSLADVQTAIDCGWSLSELRKQQSNDKLAQQQLQEEWQTTMRNAPLCGSDFKKDHGHASLSVCGKASTSSVTTTAMTSTTNAKSNHRVRALDSDDEQEENVVMADAS
jgi:hypothetical protein